MVKFVTIRKHENEYGNGNFLEVARKVAKDDDGSVEFISLTRGYRTRDGDRRFKMHLTLPVDDDVVHFLRHALEDVVTEVPTAEDDGVDVTEQTKTSEAATAEA